MNKYTISTLGGHSALEIFSGAKRHNFETLVIAQKGREKTYTKYFENLIDDYILLNHFKELTDNQTIEKLKDKNSIFIPHRYVQVYTDLKKLEKEFNVPVFGNKFLLKYEEREGNYNQYQILNDAEIPFPVSFKNPKDIDRLVLVKVREAQRNYERSFFFTSSYKDYQEKSQNLIKLGKIKEKDLENAVIEEFLIGVQVNFNFFYSPLSSKLELLGTDSRRQTNMDGFLRLPARQQLDIEHIVYPSYVESGHFAVTVKESLLEQAFELAEKLLKASKKFHPQGIIGPFALQSAILAGPPREKIVVFDISLRIPGSPGSIFTPYSHFLYDRPVSFGERIALEIEKAEKHNLLTKIIT
ncbi:5-formaminoimidazole-4-carboxamide-1-(beta)-D-ribofuranosyl 5'-monophosphate synthetase [Candidatus Gottesmanbacteria bacterium RIFCSPHIGHO2_01_FULL_39_10]|uniref:5-formaminoimidazole-4-carboxamide-1-(Beta)-D-ribofuranosyl 5'-monophosphate synthetase n=1 Tax=Candidatus Gottesmanbacteria bacterium RIFCSPHIGHO2_01_FULL_39_10 TaxID=1798375 RepID=A0A1F5ZKW1_9BACT|nr:MAG: 5-formaminoimidazole-4-carboxamide-1-(beta)-D-ribofuranosyl 5'-monophosphate synthetase [Candidatus Gottesmanbacteria bacterium RIFCSPHIGHO2_01_FULL_39_10]